MNRLCPSEDILSRYISHSLSHENKLVVEEHLIRCGQCRKLIVEAHEVLTNPDMWEIMNKILLWIKKNRWLTGSLVSLVLSFFFSEYFLQFLLIAFLLGAKWIVDARATRMLIMINESWKKNTMKEDLEAREENNK
ncbi:MAG: hypothetical protein HQ594_07150 [Candidatus Omnitrophica bacterium]|nr:hypothetical protein [Candidatus Omnitrophota bacterium]